MNVLHSPDTDGGLPVALINDLCAVHGRQRLLLAVLRAPRRPAPVAPFPTEPHLRADLGLAPLPNPTVVAGCVWMRMP
jgi:hypothetical protein